MRLRSDICACLTLPSGARYPGACSLDSEMYCRKTYVKGSDGDQREELTSEETHAPGAGRRLRGASRGSLGRLGRDALRKGKDVLCDLTLTMTDNEWHPAIHSQYQCSPVGNDRVWDLAAEAGLDIRGLDATGAVIEVRDQLHLVAAVPELLGDLHEHAYVLEARDLERHEREDHIGHIEHRDHLLLERGPCVDHDVGVALAQELEDVLHVRAGDELSRLRRRRREENLAAGRVRDEDRLEDIGVGVVERPDEIGDGLRLGAHVEDHGDVAEGKAPIDEDDGLLRELMQRDGEVRRDRRPADATFWREERDDLA